jgi:hypothetical protein
LLNKSKKHSIGKIFVVCPPWSLGRDVEPNGEEKRLAQSRVILGESRCKLCIVGILEKGEEIADVVAVVLVAPVLRESNHELAEPAVNNLVWYV